MSSDGSTTPDAPDPSVEPVDGSTAPEAPEAASVSSAVEAAAPAVQPSDAEAASAAGDAAADAATEPVAAEPVAAEPVAAPEPAAVAAPPAAPAVEAAPAAPAVEAAPAAPAVEAAPAAPAVQAAPTAPAVEAAPVAPAVEAAPAGSAADPTASAPAPQATASPEAGASQRSQPTPTAPAPSARPVPRPSPAVLAGSVRPATPAAPPAAVVADPAEPPSDSARFGRVDDDGTVHVTLPDGTEAAVGQWAAGTPAEGLAFFVRKFDDLSVEVDLATRRLREGKAAPDQAAAVVKRVREALASPSMVGDLGSLTERTDALEALVAERRRAVSEERAAAKAAALAAREAIVAEAEQLAESTQWKATGERFKALLEEWKGAPRADRAGEQALWKRFSHARSQFDKHRRQYFARLDGERGEAKQVKEALVAEAEALSDSTDWGATAGAYRDLMTRWKAAGRAGKADEEALWARFRAAQDAFFSARSAAFGQRDAGFAENLAAKEALLTEAEAIDTSDLKAAKAALRGIQERWEQIGHVPRGDKERIENRLRRVEDAVRKGEEETWRRTNPEAKARAEATVAQFQGSLDKLEKEKAKAEAAGDTRKAADAESRIATTRALLEAAQRAATEFGG
jgi:hypothetical protein